MFLPDCRAPMVGGEADKSVTSIFFTLHQHDAAIKNPASFPLEDVAKLL